jgi:hypothetical protein
VVIEYLEMSSRLEPPGKMGQASPQPIVTTTSAAMLPGWSGTLGQLLPPGAAGSLLRSTAFFDGHGALPHATVLLAWLVLGALLCGVSGLRTGHRRAAVTA